MMANRAASASRADQDGHAVADQPTVLLRGVRKHYGHGDSAVRALRGIDLEVPRGDYVAVMGASGSGKSTLMNIVGCLDVPSAGDYLLDGIHTAKLSERQLALVRNRKIGFVFQSFNLLPRTTARENVELPLCYLGMRPAQRRRRAEAALRLVGLQDRMDHRPNQLSGGQQQRVAVARALVTAPSLILADEPTGNLDSVSSHEVMALFDRLNAGGRTVVLITHEHDIAEHARRSVRMIDGEIVEDLRTRPPVTAADHGESVESGEHAEHPGHGDPGGRR
jgi:putative ABC transport system ATP-binding protein